MKSILRVVGDPYVHLIAFGVVLVRLSMAYDEEPTPIDEIAASPPVCERCLTDHGFGNPCADRARQPKVTAHATSARLKR